MNNVSLIGRITKDVELRYSPSGVAVAKFTLAVNRTFKKDGEQQADFIQVQVWRKTAENAANYCRKGSLVGVTGRIQTGSYEKDNVRIYTTDVIADNVQFLEPKSTQDSSQQQNGTNANQYQQNAPQAKQGGYDNRNYQQQGNVSVGEDDLPF